MFLRAKVSTIFLYFEVQGVRTRAEVVFCTNCNREARVFRGHGAALVGPGPELKEMPVLASINFKNVPK